MSWYCQVSGAEIIGKYTAPKSGETHHVLERRTCLFGPTFKAYTPDGTLNLGIVRDACSSKANNHLHFSVCVCNRYLSTVSLISIHSNTSTTAFFRRRTQSSARFAFLAQNQSGGEIPPIIGRSLALPCQHTTDRFLRPNQLRRQYHLRLPPQLLAPHRSLAVYFMGIRISLSTP